MAMVPEFVISERTGQLGTVLERHATENWFRVQWADDSTSYEYPDEMGEQWRPCLTRAKAEESLKVVTAYIEKKYGTGWEPKLYEPGHEGNYWNISLEGAEEWACRIKAYDETEFPSGVYVEPVYSWCLGLYPASN